MRAMLGSRHFAAQYLQMPAPPEGNIINPDWFRRYSTPPASSIISCKLGDTASKDTVSADFSRLRDGRRQGQPGAYPLDVFRKKMEYPALKQAIYAQAMNPSATIIAGFEEARRHRADPAVPRKTWTGLRAEKPIKDKVVRIERHSARLEAGQMLVPADARGSPNIFKKSRFP